MSIVHVKQVNELYEDGNTAKAKEALEKLLEMGPTNLEALKLKAFFYELEGRFDLESEIWNKIIKVDREDLDAIEYIQHRHLEDKELFYFTDETESGRRYLAYPRALIKSSMTGLAGCLIFLVISKMGILPNIGPEPTMSLSAFGFFVLTPWLFIIHHWTKSLKSICIESTGLTIETRFTTTQLQWDKLRSLAVVHSHALNHEELFLRVEPSNDKEPIYYVDLEHDSSSLKARSHFIQELQEIYPRLEFMNTDQISDNGKKINRL